MQNINITNLIIGIITCLLGQVAIPLSCFIKQVEEGICDNCSCHDNCYGHKKCVFTHGENLNEWMLISYLKLKGKCPCAKILMHKNVVIYIIVNVLLLTGIFWSNSTGVDSILWIITISALFSLSVVDWCTQYIPFEYNILIFLCGLIHLFADFSNWLEYLIGLFAVSGFLFIVDRIGTPVLRKRYPEDEVDSVIGDGDIKLMAATGLLLGWKLNFIALGIGCISGSVIHLIRMKIKGSGTKLALGPYLSLGVYITMICGEQLVSWYLNMLGLYPV